MDLGCAGEMVSLLRGLLGEALKTNPSLQFAVLTGCLRVSKESIFTGLNNFDVNSIVDVEEMAWLSLRHLLDRLRFDVFLLAAVGLVWNGHYQLSRFQ